MATRVVPFIFSATIAYTIEMGNLFMSFFFDGALVDGTGVPIDTPYLEADLPQLQFEQIGDVMWITHVDYAPYKLSRTSPTVFSLDKIVFTKGPFLLRNDVLEDDSVTMTYTGTTTEDATGTLVASSPTFEAGHVDALFQLTYPMSTADSNVKSIGDAASSFLPVKGNFSFVTHGSWAGTVELMRKEGDNPEEVFRTFDSENVGDANAQFTGTESSYNTTYRIKPKAGMSNKFSAVITNNTSLTIGIVRIDSFASSTSVGVTVLAYLGSASSAQATLRWAEGAWSDVQGYPKSITFIGNRATYGARRDVWLSRVGDFENFDADTKDDDSFGVTLTTGNEVRWVDTVDETIAVGTTGKPWSLKSNRIGTPITPTNFTFDEESGSGSADIQGIKIDNSVIFVDRVQKKIMEYTYDGNVQKYVTIELSILAEHFTATSTITWIAYQEHPESIIWFGMADGTLHSFTFNKKQNVIAYSSHPTTGSVNSGCVIPETPEDEIWFSIVRNLNSSDVTVIERFTDRRFTADEDAHFVDAGTIYDGVPITVVTGANYLEGEVVAVWADGISVGPKTVVSGQFTLDDAASVIHYGLPFTPIVKPMRLDIDSAGGSTHGSTKKAAEAVLSLLESNYVAYGDSEDALFTADLTRPELVNNTEIDGLFTGDVTVTQDAGFSIEDPLLVTNTKTDDVTDPAPLTVRAILSRVDKTGR